MDTAPRTQPTLLLNLNEVATQLRWTRRSVERHDQAPRRRRPVARPDHGRARLNGERDRRHLSRATKRELDATVRELENARDSGQQPWLLDNTTVEDWLEHWLQEILPLSVRWKTRSGYASHLCVHVIPSLGAAGLTELRPETLERLYRKLMDDGRPTHVAHGVHRVLRSSLNEAVRRQRLVTNPAAQTRPPRVERTEIEPLTADECRAILQASRGRLNGARWSVALSLGLRQGEALGLMWDDVYLDAAGCGCVEPSSAAPGPTAAARGGGRSRPVATSVGLAEFGSTRAAPRRSGTGGFFLKCRGEAALNRCDRQSSRAS